MKDETYVFISDVKDKKITARSARHQRTHNGKGGRVRLPSDNLSKKELQKMNGECKSYRLNDPMCWKEFMAMPDDIKITYVKLLRKKFNVPNKYIAEMLGINSSYFSKEINRLGISEGKNCRGRCTPWDKEGFYAWWNGVEQIPAPNLEEKKQIFFGETDKLPEEKIHWVELDPVPAEEPETYVEDDLPFEEPECDPVNPIHKKCTALEAENAELKIQVDSLRKMIEADMDVHEKVGLENDLLRKECDSLRMNVRLIFGGNRNGT